MKQIERKARYALDAEYNKHHHYNNVLYLTNRQVSWLTACLVMLSFFIFIAGYFLGQRKAIEQFNELINQELVVNSDVLHEYEQKMEIKQPDTVTTHNAAVVTAPKQYYAQLIGFGTSRAAERFYNRLQQKNMPVKVVERHSKTAQGKKIIWYQVITECFDNKDDLIAFTQKIKIEERLNDIRIVSC